MTQAYPLQWPRGRARTAERDRKPGRFTVGKDVKSPHTGNWYKAQEPITVHKATERLVQEIDRIGGQGLVISSMLELRNDGFPRSGQRAPTDPGVCIYFNLSGKPRAMPCDTYDSVAANIAAVAAHIEATRAIERHGVATVAEMFEGFTALPAPNANRPWWEVLGLRSDASAPEVETAFKSKAKMAHPDMGGSSEAMAELNRARQEALQ